MERLEAAGVGAHEEPHVAWRRLRDVEGRRVTVIDLYELVSAPRGLPPHALPLAERIDLARSVMPEIWPGFEVVEHAQRAGDPIEVIEYDPSWAQRYDWWRHRLVAHLGEAVLRVEHVGSTSVLGLAAKPTIDIQISVADLLDESRYVPQIERAGVQLRSRDDLHRYFRPYSDQPRDVHVHVCGQGSRWEDEHLLFRDYLRSHPEARDAYAEVKRAAARLWNDDGWAYTDAKSGIILDLLEAAGHWARPGPRSG